LRGKLCEFSSVSVAFFPTATGPRRVRITAPRSAKGPADPGRPTECEAASSSERRPEEPPRRWRRRPSLCASCTSASSRSGRSFRSGLAPRRRSGRNFRCGVLNLGSRPYPYTQRMSGYTSLRVDVDVRLTTATNRSLDQAVDDGLSRRFPATVHHAPETTVGSMSPS
jgi:hypothetical protein